MAPQAGEGEYVLPVGVVRHVVGIPRALQNRTFAAVEEYTFGGDGGPTGRGHIEEEQCTGAKEMYPPPPVSRNHLAQEPTPGSAVEFSHHFFYQGSGFFMFLVDVGQLFRCTGHHFMCVTTGPPIRGDPISHSQAHIPLKPLPPALDRFPEATSP